VTPRQFTIEGERGQLLLVGAVVLATVILGLAIVTNSVLFTENTGSGEIGVESAVIDEFDYEVQRSTQSILLQLNHEERNVTWSDLNSTVRTNVHNYSNLLSRSYATAGTVYVDARYTRTIHNGTRIVQRVDRAFTYNESHATTVLSDQPDWTVVQSSDRADVGWAALNVDLRNTSGEQAEIVFDNGTESLTYQFNRSKDGQGSNLSVSVDSSWAGELSNTDCQSVGGRVLVDLREGNGFFDDCTFTRIDRLTAPYDIEISDGDRLVGQYELVVNQTWQDSGSPIEASLPALGLGTAAYPDCAESGVQPPCLSPVVWEGQISLTYQSTTASYASTRNISVYGGDT
jgi:hypothetical protein